MAEALSEKDHMNKFSKIIEKSVLVIFGCLLIQQWPRFLLPQLTFPLSLITPTVHSGGAIEQSILSLFAEAKRPAGKFQGK